MIGQQQWLKLQVLENLHFDKSNGNPRRYWGWRVFGQALYRCLCTTCEANPAPGGCRAVTMKKTNRKCVCPMCECTQPRRLSDEAAVEINEFLEVITANFLRRYGHRIDRYFSKRSKRGLNDEKPWQSTDEAPF